MKFFNDDLINILGQFLNKAINFNFFSLVKLGSKN
jgi:hypothetical protein